MRSFGPSMICGGIDLGGSKIEARLFAGAEATTTATRRIPTPTVSYAGMAEALAAQVAWLCAEAGQSDLPVGIAVPGVVDPRTGMSFASNLPATGHSIAQELKERLGRAFPVVNDCMAFAYSEARGGAGDGYRRVLGLILGTGVGAGLSVDGRLPPRHGGLAIEIGHAGLSARALTRHALPLFPCGCGAVGCVETYVSGTGFSNIARERLSRAARAEDIGRDPDLDAVFEIWADLAGDCLATLQVTLAPDCIVLGGGVSNVPGVAARLSAALEARRLQAAEMPRIALARHGDSSGARGAALLAAGI